MSFLSYKISSGIKLPYSTIRGSISSRTNKSEISTEKLYEQLISITDGKSCLVQDFKSCIEKFLEPNKVEISVLHNSFKDADAAISIDSTLNNLGAKGEYKYQGYIFYFPLNSDKDKIVDIHSFRHELRHFFDYLYHPKTVSSNVIYDKIYIYDLSLMAFKYTKNILFSII